MSGLATAGDQGAQRGRKGGAKRKKIDASAGIVYLPFDYHRNRICPISADSNVVKIIRTIKERDMLPCIIFSFSRKECEAYATSLKEMDFNDGIVDWRENRYSCNSN